MLARKEHLMRRAPALLGVFAVRALGGHALRTGRGSRARSRQVLADLDRIRAPDRATAGRRQGPQDGGRADRRHQAAARHARGRLRRAFAWKPLRPGYSKGFMESYKAEIAAYKLDRMLDMHMVPPIVERQDRRPDRRGRVLGREHHAAGASPSRRRAPSRCGACSSRA